MTSFKKYSAMARSELFSLSPEKKEVFLKNLRVKHLHMETFGIKLLRLLNPNVGSSIIPIIGATGVGKTTLAKELLKAIILSRQRENKPQNIPFIYIPAPANGDRSLSWHAFYEDILRAGKEVLIEKKQYCELKDDKIFVKHGRKRLSVMRGSLLSMVENRKVEVLVIDEAYHLLRFGNYSAVMDTLKSLVDQLEVKLILIGTYDLLELVTEYGQVVRRSEILHLNRYRIGVKSDEKEFKTIIKKFEINWPWEDVPPFHRIYSELMEASLGIVGLLKEILTKTLILQNENNGKWKPEFIFKSTKSPKLLDTIRREVAFGEEKIKDALSGDSFFSREIAQHMKQKLLDGGQNA